METVFIRDEISKCEDIIVRKDVEDSENVSTAKFDAKLSEVQDEDDLERFIVAQERTYANALQEIKSGRKRSHWMWYIFPQISGLGHSPIAKKYDIV